MALLFEHHHRSVSTADSPRRSCMPLPVGWLVIAISAGLLAAAGLMCCAGVAELPDRASPSAEESVTSPSPDGDDLVFEFERIPGYGTDSTIVP